MVLHLAALPPELRALVATKCDAATAAQFALASRACALLLRQHLAFLLEAHRAKRKGMRRPASCSRHWNLHSLQRICMR